MKVLTIHVTKPEWWVLLTALKRNGWIIPSIYRPRLKPQVKIQDNNLFPLEDWFATKTLATYKKLFAIHSSVLLAAKIRKGKGRKRNKHTFLVVGILYTAVCLFVYILDRGGISNFPCIGNLHQDEGRAGQGTTELPYEEWFMDTVHVHGFWILLLFSYLIAQYLQSYFIFKIMFGLTAGVA